MSLKRPKNADVNERFTEISSWIHLLRQNSKKVIGFGYELLEKEIHHRQSGRNHIPTHAILPTVQDAVRLLKKEREAAKFVALAEMIKTEWSILQEWIRIYPHKVLAVGDDWGGVLAVLKWFSEHPRCGLYLRQLDISGIDTKFIEQRKGIIQELLTIILPEDAVNETATSFELRYGLQAKPMRIRLRLLDRTQFVQGISDMEIPVEQLAAFCPTASKAFITENEINGLCFPEVKDSLVIFGLGYGVDLLKSVPWLREKEIYYWGDIDTHGFAMLDQVRSFLPQSKSMLMDEGVLLTHRALWSTELKPFLGQLTRLTAEEHRLLCLLQSNAWGKGVRLEQERVTFSQVKSVMEMLAN